MSKDKRYTVHMEFNLLDFSCFINYFRQEVCVVLQNFSGAITSFSPPSLCNVNLLPIFNQK